MQFSSIITTTTSSHILFNSKNIFTTSSHIVSEAISIRPLALAPGTLFPSPWVVLVHHATARHAAKVVSFYNEGTAKEEGSCSCSRCCTSFWPTTTAGASLLNAWSPWSRSCTSPWHIASAGASLLNAWSTACSCYYIDAPLLHASAQSAVPLRINR